MRVRMAMWRVWMRYRRGLSEIDIDVEYVFECGYVGGNIYFVHDKR